MSPTTSSPLAPLSPFVLSSGNLTGVSNPPVWEPDLGTPYRFVPRSTASSILPSSQSSDGMSSVNLLGAGVASGVATTSGVSLGVAGASGLVAGLSSICSLGFRYILTLCGALLKVLPPTCSIPP